MVCSSMNGIQVHVLQAYVHMGQHYLPFLLCQHESALLAWRTFLCGKETDLQHSLHTLET